MKESTEVEKQENEKQDKKSQKKEPVADDDVSDNEDEGPKVKTAAQKKAEKKEREKERKRAEAKARKEKEEAKAQAAQKREEKEQEKNKTEDSKPKPQTEVKKEDSTPDAEVKGEAPEGDADDKADDKTKKDKKKKKKKDKAEEEKTKKKPGKGQIKAMQDALKRMKEEEERLKAEEEARIKAEEEAERLREEKLRLEQEKKEREKQKKKDKKARLKAEGKFLTEKQKKDKARAEATLALLREQGLIIPSREDGAEPIRRAPKPGRRRPKKQDSVEVKDDQDSTEAQKETEEEEPETIEVEKNKDDDGDAVDREEEEDEEEEDVKDTWEDIESEEEQVQEKEKPQKKSSTSSVKVKDTKLVVMDEKEKQSKEDDKEEDDEEEEEEDESGSEDESDDEDSEEESEEESEDERPVKRDSRETALDRIAKRQEKAEKNRTVDDLRSPVVVVLGHVDTGKTKILDKIRHTHVQDGEAGGITQQIGATNIPVDVIRVQTKMCREFAKKEIKIPGLLVIDTPGHESFSNLRSRGSSLCDIAILVVDIMHGLEPQTIESINLLKKRKTPFVVALNKIDRLFEWKSSPHTDVSNTIKKQKPNTKLEFDERVQQAITEFAEQGLNAALFYENKDPRTYISFVPTSAHTGDGMGNLMALITEFSQTLLAKRLAYSDELQCTVLEVKSLPGLGTTIDVVLVNGKLRESDTIIVAGQEGPIVSQVRGLLMPEPLKELRVKNPYNKFKEIKAAQGVKILAKDLEKAVAGTQLLVAVQQDEIEICKEEVEAALEDTLKSFKLSDRGVLVQASTLGSLEALLEFLRTSKIPYAGINIGPVHKRDIMKAMVMLEHDTQYAVLLAFDVKVEREAQEMAEKEGVRIFQADIIYHLFDSFMRYRDELKQKKREEFKHVAVFPCKIRILPQFIFNSRDPIVVGVVIEAGIVKEGTPVCVPSKEFLDVGIVTGVEMNHKQLESARKGQEVCIKIAPLPGDAPKMFGRHFDHTDLLVSKITRQSIDAVKNWFREDLQKSDWQLMIELKKTFEII
ncbi:eukaryotic translation initiation factor 5B-like [Saccoglossus kowalevskii]